jgi:hypothetical protein
MKPIKSGAIIDDHSEIIDIRDGKNASFDDGYDYVTEGPEDTAYRASHSGLIDGEFSLYATRADLEAVINSPTP